MSVVPVLEGRERCLNDEKSFSTASTSEVMHNGKLYARINHADSRLLRRLVGHTFSVVRKEFGGANIVLNLADRLINTH